MKSIVLLSAICLSLGGMFQSCNKVIEDYEPIGPIVEKIISPNYVRTYVSYPGSITTEWYRVYPDSLVTSWHVDGIAEFPFFKPDTVKVPTLFLAVTIADGDNDKNIIRQRLSAKELSYPKDKVDKFTELSVNNNDTSFNRWAYFPGYCIVDAIESVDITSDADYDAAHPAGSLLNDLVSVRFRSAKEFIESGYTDKRYDPMYSSDIDITESLAEFNEKQRNLVGFGFIFIFSKMPDKPAVHNFTVHYNDKGGRHNKISVNHVVINL